MIKMNAGIRTLSGITFLSNETMIFEQTNTNVTAIPIPNAPNADTETASVGQVPKTSFRTGLEAMIPFVKTVFNELPLFLMLVPPCCYMLQHIPLMRL